MLAGMKLGLTFVVCGIKHPESPHHNIQDSFSNNRG